MSSSESGKLSGSGSGVVDALMLGVSGMRGVVGTSLSPQVVMRLACAVGAYLKQSESPTNGTHFVVVLGRDSRVSGPFVRDAAAAGLTASGIEVIDLDVVTTPGVALMVKHLNADAGMIATASHNPIQWNGLKLLDRRGIAPPPAVVSVIKKMYEESVTSLASVGQIRRSLNNVETTARHVKKVMDYVDVLGISSRRFKVVLDSINGAGGVSGVTLLSKLGCNVVHLNAEPTGKFAHEPEPTQGNLTDLAQQVRKHNADVGFAQDPDADRLAIVDDTGTYIGEEYTLALCAKYILGKTPGVAATNLSTSRMIDDIAAESGSRVIRTPVGEANVIDAMLAHHCVIGGEGNGGVIDPRIVPGRDSLLSMAYVLGLLTREGKKLSQLIATMPRYEIVKTKFECRRQDADVAVDALKKHFAKEKVDVQDGIRIDWPDAWIHARASNTEPIMRVIAEAKDKATAQVRIEQVQAVIKDALKH